MPATDTVSVLPMDPLGAGVTEAGLYAQVTPAGSPAHERLTALANAFCDCTVQVVLPFPPWAMVRLDGAQENVNEFTESDMLKVCVRVPLTPRAWKL